MPRFYQGVWAALLQAPLSRFGDTAANAGVLQLLSTVNMPIAAKTLVASVAAAPLSGGAAPWLRAAKGEDAVVAAAAAATEARDAARAASAAEGASVAAAAAFERSIRTAGLRRGRENALVEEAEALAVLSHARAAAAEAHGAALAGADARACAAAALTRARREAEALAK